MLKSINQNALHLNQNLDNIYYEMVAFCKKKEDIFTNATLSELIS